MKCHMTGDPNSELCHMMKIHLQNPYSTGFWPFFVENTVSGEKRLLGIAFSFTNSREEQPTLLNYCPFCGEPLSNADGGPYYDFSGDLKSWELPCRDMPFHHGLGHRFELP